MAVRTERDLTKGSIPGHILALAIPAVLSTLVHNLYGLNDVFFSKFLGLNGQTAVSGNLFTLIVIFGFIQLPAIGTLTLVARRSGAKNEEGADRAARQGLLFAAAASLVTAAIGLSTHHLVPAIMGMRPEVASESVRYLRVLFLGLPALFFFPTVESIFRARGDTRTPLLLQVVAVATNIAGNATVVFLLKGGVAGIAVATIVSRITGTVLGLLLLRRGRVGLRLERHPGPVFDTRLWAKIAQVSAPIGTRTALFGLIYQIVFRIAAPFGTSVQNGLGVGIRVEGMCFFILVGFGLAAGPIVGQNLGGKRPDRAAKGAWTTVAMALVPAVAFSLLFALGPHLLMQVFTGDPGTQQHGADYLRIISICLVFVGVEVVLANAFVGAGDTLPPMLVDVPLTALRIPLSLWFANGLDMGAKGIWWAVSATAIARGICMALWFLRGRWRRARPDLD